MEILVLILLLVCGLTSLGCWIFTLVRLFTNEAIVHGVIGIFCALWAFIMGWSKADEMGHKTVMIIWSFAIIGGIAANILAASMGLTSN
ncbi:hypothetical protein [Poriferisphaera sp. WC338]|uniref:hypothetical protein n=1 Tax=Poriferisphaera sp. WC338 TaxID=3425129 RepID=UPI003D8149D5